MRFKQLAIAKEREIHQRCFNHSALHDHHLVHDNSVSVVISQKEISTEEQLVVERRISGYKSSIGLTSPSLVKPSDNETECTDNAAVTVSADVSQSIALDSYSVDDASVITTTAAETANIDDFARLTSGRSSDSGTVVESLAQLSITTDVKNDMYA